jgi:hypothetical protein
VRSDIDDKRRLRLEQAVQYLLNEHGGNAIEEAESALRYAQQINDQDTVDVFREVLDHIASLHSK